MSSDEERLYDHAEEEDDEITQNIDAVSSTHKPSTSEHEDSNAIATSDVKHRWFILEPAVFLVFLAMYLSSKIMIIT